LLGYCAYTGTKRGAVLMGFELGSFLVATIVAFIGYHSLGSQLKDMLQVATSLANVAAFALIWIVTEIACALTVRFLILRHLTRDVQISRPNRIGGGFLNAFKFSVITLLGLITFAGLPLSASTKKVVTDAAIPGFLLHSTGALQQQLAGGLGRDLGQSLNFFTITNDPADEKTVELGYTTTSTASPKDEDEMLVLLNAERIARKLEPLSMNTTARDVARAYSKDLFARGYFSHISREGLTPFQRMQAGKVKYGQAGENLALAPTLKLAHQGLMNSPGHRANILNPDYRTVGIGIMDGGSYGLMVTQNFTD
ncbi:MAG: uncharacterized protein K0S68_1014, partial [Candidatus Saccharibacteria bacterium]|nr:uncharacterized protein [Candidatus Saccharibacteria bacterium]